MARQQLGSFDGHFKFVVGAQSRRKSEARVDTTMYVPPQDLQFNLVQVEPQKLGRSQRQRVQLSIGLELVVNLNLRFDLPLNAEGLSHT